MTIVQRGDGPALVLVPGIQGGWEYMRPAIDALAQSFRVITFSLCGERGSGWGRPRGMDDYADQVARALDVCHLQQAIVCGVSFGGLVALRFAARYTATTSALVLVSTPGPGFRLRPRHEWFARHPRLCGPLFIAGFPTRVGPELVRAIPDRRCLARFAWGQLSAFGRAGVSFPRMAERARLIGTLDTAADCARVSAPTLVVSGEPPLDHVVSAEGTCEYARLIQGARAVRLDRTGHLGAITRPDAFAAAVRDFVRAAEGGGPDPGGRRTDPHAA
jgi:pimeloyl-ACP methyl ester carboxylesterase